MTWRSTRAKRCETNSFNSHQEKFLALLMKAGEDECWKINVGINVDPLKKYCTFSYKHPSCDTAKTFIARKVSYEIFVGEVEKGKVITTTCGKLGCVNPKHLAISSRSEMASKNRGDYEKNY